MGYELATLWLTTDGSSKPAALSGAGYGDTGEVTFTVNVSPPNVVAMGGFPFSAVEGAASAAQTVATFTDPGGAGSLADYSASITWGDASAATAGRIYRDSTQPAHPLLPAHEFV
jgi:hypothetical protein